MTAATGEAVDTRAADAAWWAMDVPCEWWREPCTTPAAWILTKPCGHQRLWCDKHNVEDHRRSSMAMRCVCTECEAYFDSDECTRRPL